MNHGLTVLLLLVVGCRGTPSTAADTADGGPGTGSDDTGLMDTADTGDSTELPPAVVAVAGAGAAACIALAEGGVVCVTDDVTWHEGGRYDQLGDRGGGMCGVSGGRVDCWHMRTKCCEEPVAAELPVLEDAPDGDGWVMVDGSTFNACALSTTGEVACWGVFTHPELGSYSEGYPVTVPEGAGWLDLTMSGDCELCALDADGHVRCFPTPSQLENGTCGEAPFDDDVYVDVASNDGQVAAIRADDGRVDSRYGFISSRVLTSESGGYVAVSPWYGGTCALTASGSIECWGSETYAPDPVAAGLTGTYTDLLLAEALYVIDTDGQLHWTGDDTREDRVSFWDAVGVPNPDDR